MCSLFIICLCGSKEQSVTLPVNPVRKLQRKTARGKIKNKFLCQTVCVHVIVSPNALIRKIYLIDQSDTSASQKTGGKYRLCCVEEFPKGR